MTSRIALLLPAFILAISASAQTDTVSTDAVVEEVETKRCIATRQLKSNVVLDDANILFFTLGNTVYRNQLPEACAGLLEYKTFSYQQFAGRICETDIINVHRNNDPSIVRRCRLGDFQVIDSQDIPALINSLHRPPKAESLPSAEVEEVTKESQPPE